MAQGKIQGASFGDELYDYTVAADATALGGDDAWLIVGANVATRDQVAEVLERLRLRILDPDLTPFPLA